MSYFAKKYQSTPLAMLGMLGITMVAAIAVPIVILDAGHGGREPGAVHQVTEKSLNLDLCFAVERHLHQFGVDTALTRQDDRTISLGDRASYARLFPSQRTIFVSLHYNAAPNAVANGIETFYAPSRASKELAVSVQHQLIGATGATDRRCKKGSQLAVLSSNNSAHSAILVEGGFMTNAKELQRIRNPYYREHQAFAIARGIVEYLRHSHSLDQYSSAPKTSFVSNQPLRPQAAQPRRLRMTQRLPQHVPTQAVIVSMRPNQRSQSVHHTSYQSQPRPIRSNRRFLGFLRQ